jgi:phage shock protein A
MTRRAPLTGCRQVAREHGRLQHELAELREYVDEAVETGTDQIADEAAAVLRRLTLAAQHLRRRAERLHPNLQEIA